MLYSHFDHILKIIFFIKYITTLFVIDGYVPFLPGSRKFFRGGGGWVPKDKCLPGGGGGVRGIFVVILQLK